MNRRSWSPMNFLSLLTSRHLPEMVVLLAFWLAPAAYAQPASRAFIQNGNVAISGPGGRAFHPGHTLVRFRPGASPVFHPGSGAAVRFSALSGLFLVNNPPGLSVAEAVNRYHANPNVLYAEPDFYVQAVTTAPTDPLWSQQYDMVKIAAPTAWDTQTNAAGVIVAIIDKIGRASCRGRRVKLAVWVTVR